MANYLKRNAIQFAAEGKIDDLKACSPNNGEYLLYYAVKHSRLECAKYLLSMYPNSKIHISKLPNILIKCENDVIVWSVESGICTAHNNILLDKFVYQSMCRNFKLGIDKSINNIRLALRLGYDIDKTINEYWPEGTKKKITKGVAEILEVCKVIKRSNKWSKV